MPAPLKLSPREQQILEAREQLWQSQRHPPTTRQIADVVGLKPKNVYQVLYRLVEKGHLERSANGLVRPSPAVAAGLRPSQRLEGTWPGQLILTIHLTGHPKQVISDAQKAIARLTWFAEQLQADLS
jgi:SOS-response transcriptional repressor LexA